LLSPDDLEALEETIAILHDDEAVRQRRTWPRRCVAAVRPR